MPATVRIPAKRAIVLTEMHVTEAVIGWLKSKQWLCFRLQSGLVDLPGGRKMRVGTPGLPDWICCKRDKYFFLELKRPGRFLTDDQHIWFNHAHGNHIPCMWADGLGTFLDRFHNEPWSKA
jgi:hypothetical protein